MVQYILSIYGKLNFSPNFASPIYYMQVPMRTYPYSAMPCVLYRQILTPVDYREAT